jgi:hypothetical protein
MSFDIQSWSKISNGSTFIFGKRRAIFNNKVLDKVGNVENKRATPIDRVTIPEVSIRDLDKYFLCCEGSPHDYISSIRIKKFSNDLVTYQNSTTNESFVLNWHYVDITFKGFLKSYKYTCGNKMMVINDYAFVNNLHGYLTLSIKDILKHYYYLNRELNDFGLHDVDPNDMKVYKKLFQMSIEDIAVVINTKKIVGSINKMSYYVYRAKNDQYECSMSAYLGSLVFFNPKKLGNRAIIKSILSLYVDGSSKSKYSDGIVYYDPPVPLEQAYREHEDIIYNHRSKMTYSELTRSLKQKELKIIDNYAKLIIDQAIESLHYNPLEPVIKMMNYPPFAYRKFLVSKWCPGTDAYEINYHLRNACTYRKYSKVKYAQEKRGKPINRGNTTQNDGLILSNFRWGDLEFYATRKKSEYYHNRKRSLKYDIMESVNDYYNPEEHNIEECDTEECNTEECDTEECNTEECDTEECNVEEHNMEKYSGYIDVSLKLDASNCDLIANGYDYCDI